MIRGSRPTFGASPQVAQETVTLPDGSLVLIREYANGIRTAKLKVEGRYQGESAPMDRRVFARVGA